MTTLLQLKSFVAVVDQGGFTAASRRLGLSQPAVSRAIATLEKELGLPLLVRGRDGTSLTEAGALALKHAREALRHLTLMCTEVSALVGDITGTLSLASLPSVTATLVAPQLQVFAMHHPAVTIRLLEGSEQEVRDWLTKAQPRPVWSVRPPMAWTGGTRQTRTWSHRAGRQLVGRVERGEVRRASQGAVHPLDWGCAEVFTPVARQVGIEFDVAFEAREISEVLQIVRAGLGVSILPSAGLPDLPDGVVVRPLVPKTVRRVGVAVSASASAPARAFLEQIAALDLH